MEFIQPLWPAYPEIFLLVMVSVILVADLFVAEDNKIVTYGLTLATLAGCVIVTWMTAWAEPVYTFSGMFVADLLSSVLKLFVYVSVAVVMVYSRPYLAE